MAFLQVNGYTIPIASCSSNDLIIGGRSRAFDGTPISEERGKKRILECETPPLTELVREAIRGIIAGDGYVFPFGAANKETSADLYSYKGIAPESTYDNATVEPVYGALPDKLYFATEEARIDAPQVEFSPLRTGVLSVDPVTTNLFGADTRDCENAPTGFAGYGGGTVSAAVGGVNDPVWRGTKALKIVHSTISTGAETATIDPGAGSAGKTYVATFMVWAADTQVWQFYLLDNTNAANGSLTTKTVPGAQWVRVSCILTIGGSDCRDLRARLVGINPGIRTLIADSFQLEELDWPTAWVDGVRSSADNLRYSLSEMGAGSWSDFSIGIWFYGPDASDFPSHGNDAYIWGAASGVAAAALKESSVYLFRSSGGDTVTFRTIDVAGTTRDLSCAGSIINWDAWNYAAVSYRMNPETGEACKTLRIINSSNQATYTDNTQHSVHVGLAESIDVGNLSGVGQWIGLLGEMVIFPFAMPVDAWDGIAITLGNYGQNIDDYAIPLGRWPAKIVTGDASPYLQSRGELANTAYRPLGMPLYEGYVTGMKSVRGNIDGARSDLRTVSFVLEGV